MIGGTCINTGTIPSKTMREAVLHLSGFNYQGIYGVNYRVKEKITMADLLLPGPARDQERNRRHAGAALPQRHHAAHGVASFVDPHTIKVVNANGETTCRADAFIIATGTGRPSRRTCR